MKMQKNMTTRLGSKLQAQCAVAAVIACLAWVTFSGVAVRAQEVPTTPARQDPFGNSTPTSRPEATAVDQLPAVSLALGRSTIVQSPTPIKRVSVTDPKIADIQAITPNQVMVSAKALGATDLIVWGPTEEAHAIPIVVGVDQPAVRSELAALLPNSKLDLRLSNNVLVVSGMLNRAEEAESLHRFMEAANLKYVDMTTLPGLRQVQIKVVVAETSRVALRSLGINAAYNDGHSFGATNTDLNQFALGPDPVTGVSSLFDNSPSPAVTLFGRAVAGSTAITAFIAALADNQYARVLAEPTLVARSGEEASFLAGGEFPIPVIQAATGGAASNSITIEYKEFGVRLKFRPTVLGEGTIRLHVAPEVSELSNGTGAVQLQGFSIPAILTRRAETTLELCNGQTFAIGGLISQSTQARSQRVPALGDLPVLGSLFRSVRYQQGDTELVLLVTASLVQPESMGATPPVPGITHVAPDDWELYSLARLESAKGGKLSEADAKWLQESGLSKLHGPGAWATYDAPAASAQPQLGATAAAPAAAH